MAAELAAGVRVGTGERGGAATGREMRGRFGGDGGHAAGAAEFGALIASGFILCTEDSW
jgi:hypothetical protein